MIRWDSDEAHTTTPQQVLLLLLLLLLLLPLLPKPVSLMGTKRGDKALDSLRL